MLCIGLWWDWCFTEDLPEIAWAEVKSKTFCIGCLLSVTAERMLLHSISRRISAFLFSFGADVKVSAMPSANGQKEPGVFHGRMNFFRSHLISCELKIMKFWWDRSAKWGREQKQSLSSCIALDSSPLSTFVVFILIPALPQISCQTFS